MSINIMIWNETLLINTYIFGWWGWRWWQYIDNPNNNINTCIICIGYYTVDCTIPKYIWTSAQMTIGSSNMVKLSGHESKYIRYCTVNCVITFLLYIQVFKENATFKLHFALIFLPCNKHNVTYIRFLKYMHF